MEFGEEDELLEDIHLGVEAALFRQIPPRAPGHLRVERAVPGNRAGVRPQDVQNDPHRRRLAGAICAKEAEDLARFDLERNAVECVDLTEALGHRVDDQRHDLPAWRNRRR